MNNRYYSKKQENKVAEKLGGKRVPNSGATLFEKGDVKAEELLVECKTLVKPQKSHSIRKEWLEKVREEAFSRGKRFSALCMDFGDGDNFFVLRERDFIELYEAWKTLQNLEG